MISIKYPLKSLTYNFPKRLSKELEQLIADEVNVWEVKWDPTLKECVLDTSTSPEQDAEYERRLKHREEMEFRKKNNLNYEKSIPYN